MPSMKRIQSVTIKRILDTDPDTSYLGEYSNRAQGDYSIDRAHSVDCVVNNEHVTEPTVNKLERALRYLDEQRFVDGCTDEQNDALVTAMDVLETAQCELTECDCGESGSLSRNEYRYFNTSGNYTGESIDDIVKYTKQDYARMQAYNNQDWCYIGIRAESKIVVDGHIQTITSSGLWGIESDSDRDYLESIESEELADLRTQLYALGFSKRAIATACKQIEHKDE
jgi:hypothetical protein